MWTSLVAVRFRNTVTILMALCLKFTLGEPEAPPIVLDARHVSLNAIRVTWKAADGDNRTWERGYTVAIAKENCSNPDQIYMVKDKEEWTFWKLVPGANYVVCLKSLSPDGDTSQWTSVRVESHVVQPPSIKDTDKTHYIYYPSEQIVLPCKASGKPFPVIQWFHNKAQVEQRTDSSLDVDKAGNLILRQASAKHEGTYVCVAQNQAGKAQSQAFLLQLAVLHPFPSDEQQRKLEVMPGDSQKLECRSPFSLPPAAVSWNKVDSLIDPRPVPVKSNHRIKVTDDGTLLFVYTTPEDTGYYQCELHNYILDDGILGSYTHLKVEGRQDYNYPPRPLYKNPEHQQVALVGQNAVMKCVFSGRGVPVVMWYREGGFPHQRYQLEDDNTTLIIKNVQVKDAGEYSCQGRNSIEVSPHKVYFQLLVNAAPVWTVKPTSVNVTVGQNVTLQCQASGIPEPTVQWLSNGEPIDVKSLNMDNLHISGSTLTLTNISKDDIMNVQCNVSNYHGYVYTDAYINVLEPTQIVRPPEDLVLQDYGIMEFPCVVTSDPSTFLKVTWLRSNKTITEDVPRIYVNVEGSLIINATNEEDRGNSFLALYTCLVDNGVEVQRADARLKPHPSDSNMPSLSPVMSKYAMPYNQLLWIGVGGGLGGLFMICSVVLVLIRKRASPLVRSSTDTSILTYLSAASRGEDEHNSKYWIGYELPGGSTGSSGGGMSNMSEDTIKETIQEVYIPRSRIELGSLVGKGQFGRVYSATLKDYKGKSTTKVAVKTLKYRAEETDMVDLFLREAILMKDFRHPHVLSLIGISFERDASPMVILPFMANGDLRRYIQEPKRDITVLELLKLGLQVARGMSYLSNMRFVHRDLAARNCMVDSHIVVKVADFGLSRDLYSRDYYRIEDGKTPLPIRWMAPECLEASVFTVKSDMWSYGVLLWELMTRGAVPYPDIDNWDIASYVQGGKRLAQPLYCPDSVYDIMQTCWATNPGDRPTFAEVVAKIDAVVNSANVLHDTD